MRAQNLSTSIEQLAEEIRSTRDRHGDRVAVGISGFGGAGKSTLARALVSTLDGATRLRGDDFLDPIRSHVASVDWNGVDRARLAEVLLSFKATGTATFRPYDWESRGLGEEAQLPTSQILVVDVVGLFHPDILPLLDFAVWIDVDLDTATQRGKKRDRELGSDHDRLWMTCGYRTNGYSPRDSIRVLTPLISGRMKDTKSLKRSSSTRAVGKQLTLVPRPRYLGSTRTVFPAHADHARQPLARFGVTCNT